MVRLLDDLAERPDSAVALAPAPHGAYLVSFGGPLSDPKMAQALATPSLDGVFLYLRWSDLEPTDGSFDFSSLDADLDAVPSGMGVSIAVAAGAHAPAWLCALKPSPCLHFTIIPEATPSQCNAVSLPKPYDPTFQARWLAFIDALAAHLRAAPSRLAKVSVIKVTGINGETAETTLPSQPATTASCTSGSGCVAGTCNKPDDTSLWLANGYSLAALQAAWIKIADEFHAQLPGQRLDYQHGPAFPADSNPSLHVVLMSYGIAHYPGFVAQSNGLTAVGGAPQPIVDAATAGAVTGYQTFYYVFGDSQCRMARSITIATGTCPESILHDAIDVAKSKSAKFVELYEQDVNGFPAEVLYAHQQL
jgi:hypothetical protein